MFEHFSSSFCRLFTCFHFRRHTPSKHMWSHTFCPTQTSLTTKGHSPKTSGFQNSFWRTHIHHQFYHQDGQRSPSPFSELRSGWTWSMGEVYVSTTLASQRHPRGLAIDTDTPSTRSPTASSSPALVGEVWGSCWCDGLLSPPQDQQAPSPHPTL